MPNSRTIIPFLCALMLASTCATHAAEQPVPRTISDITALLDQFKPDPARLAALKAVVEREPPNGIDQESLARFYRERANAMQLLGRSQQQIADLKRALQLVPPSDARNSGIQQDLAQAEMDAGNFFNALKIRQAQVENEKGRDNVYSRLTNLSRMYATLGDLSEARILLRNAEALLPKLQRTKGWADTNQVRISQLELTRAELLEAEGKLVEAESGYRKALAAREGFLEVADDVITRRAREPSRERYDRARDNIERQLANVLRKQGRYAEAELAIRNVLKQSLARLGRYAPGTARAATVFANVLSEQGRYRDAEVMARAALEIFQILGSTPDATSSIRAQRALAQSLALQKRWPDALAVYEELRKNLAADPRSLEQFGRGDTYWALALIRTSRSGEAVTMLEFLVKQTRERFGDEGYALGEQRGFLALALAESGQRQRALAEYQAAIRVLLSRVALDDDNEATARSWRLSQILEGYIDLLYQMRGEAQGASATALAFRLADAGRGGSAQRALVASAARASAGTPALAELVRREQDARQQMTTFHNLLRRMLSAPADQQLPQVIAQLRQRIAETQKEHRALNADLDKQFPAYVNLIHPRPVTLDQARASLREGEVLLSMLTGEARTYVWAAPKQGPVLFHAAEMGEAEISRTVAGLRRALDVGEVAITRVPEFDVAQAAKLYDTLLKPVESAWKGAQTLLVVGNGALAQLPFGVLPTGPATISAQGLRFEQYQSVSWLIKQIAVAQLPAVNTLVTLRSLPQGNAQRIAFAGFGDPQFDGKQAAAPAPLQVAMRSMDIRRVTDAASRDGSAPVNYLPYSALPPLPDTRDEILAIATALKADVNRDVFLGLQANKQSLKDANLANRRIVAFATHGLVPGDFPNLDQPALALSATDGKAETGLLTLEDILQLKLDADWVVLSACNTAAGDGAGAEAISGLGRGFFYAGSRALLVTHWPVETVSAKNLVTKLFERYTADPKLTRAEALRQAHLSVMNEYASEGGKPAYSYAHPLFWAPYALVGDGGR